MTKNKNMEIKLEKVSNNKVSFVYKAFTPNNKYLGTFELDESGFYSYWQDKSLNGAWSAYQLRAIADKLDEVNKPFEKELELYFGKETTKVKINDLSVEL